MFSQINGKHMRQEASPRAYAKMVCLACVLAVLAEAGTIFGAPALSLADPSSWKPIRIIVFFLLALCPAWRLSRVAARGISPAAVLEFLAEEGMGPSQLRMSGIALASSCVGGYVAQQVVAALRGVDDPRCGIFAASLLAAGSLLVVNRRVHRAHPEWGYLALALCMGMTICALMPTAAEISFDGQSHFNKAQAMSYVVDAEYTGADRIMTWGGTQIGGLTGLEMEKNAEYLWVELGSREIPFPHPDMSLDALQRSSEILRDAEESVPLTVLDGPSTLGGTYLSPRSLGLMPNAVGLWVGRLLHLSCELRFLAGRVANMLFYVLVFFLSIRNLRSGKLIAAAIGLLPSSMLLAANYSYDPWHISLLAYSVTRFLGLLQEGRPLAARDTRGVIASFILGVLVKAVLFPLGLIFLLIPAKLFATERDARIYRMCVILALAIPLGAIGIAMLLIALSGDVGAALATAIISSDTRGGHDVNALAQITFVRDNVPYTLGRIARLLVGMFDPRRAAIGMGPTDENLLYYFPYLIPTYAPLTEWVALGKATCLLAVSMLDRSREDEAYANLPMRLTTAAAALAGAAFISLALYVSFTDVGRDVITGVQYRYFIPLLAPVLLVELNTAIFRRRPAWAHLPTVFFAVELVLGALVLVNSFVIWF